MNKFTVGDPVVLRCGGHKMVIDEINSNGQARCVWHDEDGGAQCEWYAMSSLEEPEEYDTPEKFN